MTWFMKSYDHFETRRKKMPAFSAWKSREMSSWVVEKSEGGRKMSHGRSGFMSVMSRSVQLFVGFNVHVRQMQILNSTETYLHEPFQSF